VAPGILPHSVGRRMSAFVFAYTVERVSRWLMQT
jgi:hypothetical protein